MSPRESPGRGPPRLALAVFWRAGGGFSISREGRGVRTEGREGRAALADLPVHGRRADLDIDHLRGLVDALAEGDVDDEEHEEHHAVEADARHGEDERAMAGERAPRRGQYWYGRRRRAPRRAPLRAQRRVDVWTDHFPGPSPLLIGGC